MIIANSLASAAIMGLLHSALKEELPSKAANMIGQMHMNGKIPLKTIQKFITLRIRSSLIPILIDFYIWDVHENQI